MYLKQAIYKPDENPNKQDYVVIDENIQIVQLGIQGLPGTQFYLNNINSNINNFLTIGTTGIFELDLQGTGGYISSIVFPYTGGQGEDNLALYKDSNVKLIIDYLYKK